MGKRSKKLKNKKRKKKVFLLCIFSVLFGITAGTSVSGDAAEYGDWAAETSGEESPEEELQVNQDGGYRERSEAEEIWNRDNAVWGAGNSGDFSSGENIQNTENTEEQERHRTPEIQSRKTPETVPESSATQEGSQRESQESPSETPSEKKRRKQKKQTSKQEKKEDDRQKKKNQEKEAQKNKLAKNKISENKRIEAENKKKEIAPETTISDAEVVYQYFNVENCKKVEIKLNSPAVISVISLETENPDKQWIQEGNRILLSFEDTNSGYIRIALLCRRDFAWTKRQKNAILSYNTF